MEKITDSLATELGNEIGVKWSEIKLAELKKGIKDELKEHSKTARAFGVGSVDLLEYATSIAVDHLSQDPLYYTKLKKAGL